MYIGTGFILRDIADQGEADPTRVKGYKRQGAYRMSNSTYFLE